MGLLLALIVFIAVCYIWADPDRVASFDAVQSMIKDYGKTIQPISLIVGLITLAISIICFTYSEENPTPAFPSMMTAHDYFIDRVGDLVIPCFIIGIVALLTHHVTKKERWALNYLKESDDYEKATDNYFFHQAMPNYYFAQESGKYHLGDYDYQQLGLKTYHHMFGIYKFDDNSIAFEPSTLNQRYYLININFRPHYETNISGGETTINGGKLIPHAFGNGYDMKLNTQSNPIQSSQYEVPTPAILTLLPVNSSNAFNIQISNANKEYVVNLEQHFLLSQYNQQQLGIIN